MLLPKTHVTLLDTNSKYSGLCIKGLHAEDIIPAYHIDSKFNGDYDDNGYKILAVAKLKGDNIKIRDLAGWATVTSITVVEIPSTKKHFMIDDDYEFIISEDEIIPVYYPRDSKDGFHGATLFRHELVNINELGGNVAVLRNDMNSFKVANIKEVSSITSVAYKIETASGFYSVGSSNYRFNGGCKQRIGYS